MTSHMTHLEELQKLLKLRNDLRTTLDTLPEKQELVTLKSTLQAIKEKRVQLVKIFEDKQGELEVHIREKRACQEQIAAIQTKIESDQTNYRRISEESDALAALIAKQDDIVAHMQKLEESLLGFESMSEEIDKAIALKKEQELNLTQIYKTKGEALIKKIQDVDVRTVHIKERIGADMFDVFQRVFQEKKGVALAHLDADGVCSACKVHIEPQKIAHLKKSEGLVFCPSCNRIVTIA